MNNRKKRNKYPRRPAISRRRSFPPNDKMVLKKVLNEYKIPQTLYSLDGYAEDCVCMEYTHNGWIVYIGQRGNKHSITNHDTFSSACERVIERIAESETEKDEILSAFKTKLYSGCIKKTFKSGKTIRTNSLDPKDMTVMLACQMHKYPSRKQSKRKEDA